MLNYSKPIFIFHIFILKDMSDFGFLELKYANWQSEQKLTSFSYETKPVFKGGRDIQ